MDGALIATVVSSSVVVGGAIISGFWRISTRIGNQDKSIGILGGKVDGLRTSTDIVQKQILGIDQRIDRLDGRINGIITGSKSEDIQR